MTVSVAQNGHSLYTSTPALTTLCVVLVTPVGGKCRAASISQLTQTGSFTKAPLFNSRTRRNRGIFGASKVILVLCLVLLVLRVMRYPGLHVHPKLKRQLANALLNA